MKKRTKNLRFDLQKQKQMAPKREKSNWDFIADTVRPAARSREVVLLFAECI